MKGRKFLLIILIIVGLLAAGGIFIYASYDKPPLKDVENARIQIEKLRKSKTKIYYPAAYKKTMAMYDSMIAGWKAENEKWILKRNYSKIRVLANNICESSKSLLSKSQQKHSQLDSSLSFLIDSLKKRNRDALETSQLLYLPNSIKNDLSRGSLYLSEAKLFYEKKQLNECEDALNKARMLHESFKKQTEKYLKDYFTDFNNWKSWSQKAKEASNSGDNKVILVDKFARKCYVLFRGITIQEFNVELGPKWIGDKFRKGDKATPEGIYKVTQRKEGHKTKYYKALLINYPNEEDKIRFHRARLNGTIPRNAEIGNLIEIHGGGGRGEDWTDGCVALTNKDMDILYKLSSPGTIVTIVGSLRNYDEIIQQYKL